MATNHSDGELWGLIAAADSQAMIGLKSPGRARGVFRNRILIGDAERSQVTNALRDQVGVTLLSADTLLPTTRVHILNLDVLRRIRQLPFVDYIEPAVIRNEPAGIWASGGYTGCEEPAVEGAFSVYGGDLLPEIFSAMQIPEAWARSTGRGITIGLTDTGIFSTQSELLGDYASGESAGRSVELYGVNGMSGFADCTHGTRMAGAMVAPKNGRQVIGVAWGANLVSVRQANGVEAVDVANARDAIRKVIERGSRIITMAWQSMDWSSTVSDEILYWYYERDVLFFGAAGTSTCVPHGQHDNVLFPAEMDEVIAVTGLHYPSGTIDCSVHRGPEVDLAAYISQPTTGVTSSHLINISGSSNATGIVSGIAALVWSQNPTWNRSQVQGRLFTAAEGHGARTWYVGFGLINAYCAVGGFCDLQIEGPGAVNSAYDNYATFTARPFIGSGSFSYQWSSGETTRTIARTIDPGSDSCTVSVTVTDLATGESLTQSKIVDVWYEESCPTCLQ